MTHKMRKTLIMIVMAALIICLMAASLTYTFTYGLYTGGKFDSENSPYDDLIEFVGAREYTVRSPEELIQAIEDGYSNIVISEDAEQPFVITEGVTDVEANLVLNLNGNVVVRNSRNPMLDVQTNVSVVLVYDSKNTGAFYNPVGSSLMASGGSLTVGSGGYESGPRAEEFQGNASAGTLGSAANATLFARSNGENAVTSPVDLDRSQYISGYSPVAGVSLPTITPKTTQENNRETVRGNVYLNSTHSDWLPADTFLVYTEAQNCFIGDGTSSGGVTFEEGKLYVDAEKETVGNDTIITASEFTTPLCDVASCDFYYYYPVNDTAGTSESFQTYAIVYGYWDVMKLAGNDGGTAEDLREKGLVYPYGAVRMVEGEGIVRGGTFYNHFDVANTYGIYAEGGRLSVSRNTTFETTFSSGGEGVCIRSSGESAELTISGGDFSSEVGNTIEMLNGNMTVTKGSFIKTGCKEGTGDKQLENQTAIISLLGGTLNVSGAKTGDVTMTAGAENSTLENVFGIRADGGGTVTTKGVSFQIYGDYSAGVLSYDGTIDLGDDTAITVEQSDQYENGNNTLLTSAGVSSEQASGNEENPVNLSGYNVTIDSNGLGITARGVVNVKGGSTSTVTTTRGTGIYVNNGQFNVEKDATISVESMVQSGYSWATPPESETTNAPNIYNGVYVQGGSIASEGTLNVTHTGEASDGNAAKHYSSYAVSVEGGNVTLGSGAIAGNSAGGIYVSGGELTAGAVTVSAGGMVTDDIFTADEPTYAAGVLVETGTVTLSGAKIYSTALGVAVLGGNFTTEGTSSVTATRATGIYVQGGTVTNSGTLDVTSTISSSWENEGADFDNASFKTSRFNGIFVNGGSLNSTGMLNVTHTGVENDAPGSGDNNISDLNGFTAYRLFQIKSYAVRVEGTTGTTVEITSGSITNSVGGGVLVNGGAVTLGVENGNTGPTVQTTGTELYYDETSNWISDQLYDAYSNVSNEANGKSWKYLLSSEGGPAIKIVGGTLSVYGGKYEAQQGDGIVTNGGSSYIHNGEFIGKDSYTILDDRYGIRFLKIEGNTTTTSPLAGPAASYAFKVYSGTATVYDGTFGDPKSTSGASGAFVMGTSATNTGTANIYGGTFDVSNSGTSGGQAGFSAYVYTNITFKENGSDENGKGGEIQVQGLAAGLTLESAGAGNNNPYQGGSAQVTIKGGKFSSTKDENNSDGIWYGNGSTTLNISGDSTFTGAARSGLWFEVNPGNNVQLSGGTYYGPKNDVSISYFWGLIASISNSINHNAIDGSANISYENLIMDSHVVTGMIEYSNQPSGPDYPTSPSVITGNGIQDHPTATANLGATRGSVYYSMITIS